MPFYTILNIFITSTKQNYLIYALPALTFSELTWRTTSAFRRLARSCSNGVPGLRRSPSTGMLSRSFPTWTAYPRRCRKVGPARRRGTHFSASPSSPFCVICAWWTPRWNPPSSCRPAGSSASCRGSAAERHTGSRCPSGPACRSRLEGKTRDDSNTMRVFLRVNHANGLTRKRQADGHVAEETVRWMPDEGQCQRRRDRHDGTGRQSDTSVVREPEDPLLSMVRCPPRGFVLAHGVTGTSGTVGCGRLSQHGQTEEQQQKASSLRHSASSELPWRDTWEHVCHVNKYKKPFARDSFGLRAFVASKRQRWG